MSLWPWHANPSPHKARWKLAVPPLPSLPFPWPLSLPFCTHLITRLRSISSASPTSSVSLHHHHHRHHHRLCRALIVEVYFNCQPQRRLFVPAVALPLFASLVYLFGRMSLEMWVHVASTHCTCTCSTSHWFWLQLKFALIMLVSGKYARHALGSATTLCYTKGCVGSTL